MLAALATLAFLIAGWAAMAALFASIDDGWAKIAAALRGESRLSAQALPPHLLPTAPLRVSARWARTAPLRATPEWRAAA